MCMYVRICSLCMYVCACVCLYVCLYISGGCLHVCNCCMCFLREVFMRTQISSRLYVLCTAFFMGYKYYSTDLSVW